MFVERDSSLLGSNTSLRPALPLIFSQHTSVLLSQDASAELGVDLEREIPIVYQKDSSFADSLWSILPMALVLGAWIFITRRTRKCHRPLVL
jgi:ATP-dependent Zn protease